MAPECVEDLLTIEKKSKWNKKCLQGSFRCRGTLHEYVKEISTSLFGIVYRKGAKPLMGRMNLYSSRERNRWS